MHSFCSYPNSTCLLPQPLDSPGLVDCVSFVIMNRYKINQALTFDRHFVQAGFIALMR
jgi:predicted nucleic acid-binding protein